MEGLTVRIDLYGNNEADDMWEGIIYGVTQDEIYKLYEEYDKKYNNQEFDGAWEDYLNANNVKFKLHSFDVEIC